MKDFEVQATGGGGTTGVLNAQDMNSIMIEGENLVTSSGQTLSAVGPTVADPDTSQSARAVTIISSAGQWGIDSGAADAYVISKTGAIITPTAYFDGMVIKFRAANANTAGSTINVFGIGAVDLVTEAGTALTAGYIDTAQDTFARYDSTAGDFFVTQSAGTGGSVVAINVVQVVASFNGQGATGTTILPRDDTIPQQTEGNQFLTVTITPTDAANNLIVEALFNGSHSSGPTEVTAALFRDSTANAIGVGADSFTTSSHVDQVFASATVAAGSTSPTTFKLRVGSNVAGTVTFNGNSSVRQYGGAMGSYIKVTEVKP